MYSVVMATMLAAGTTTPAWHHHHHRCYTSCYSCYSSCYSCYSSCHGCYSGCHTYRHHWHGCYSSCSCSCYSCYSGYAGYSGYYCSGCSCSCTIVYYSSCSVCSTCSICCTTEAAPRVIEVPAKKTEKVPVPKQNQNQNQNEESVSTVQKSRVTVVLPADAKLWVDNVECPLTSNVRSFDTPNLNANQQYVYNLRMEVVRNGQTVVQNQRAIITPGQPVQVDFNQGAVATAAR